MSGKIILEKMKSNSIVNKRRIYYFINSKGNCKIKCLQEIYIYQSI